MILQGSKCTAANRNDVPVREIVTNIVPVRESMENIAPMVDKYLGKNIKVLDGGLATEIEKKGFTLLKDPLWSARLLYTNPDSVIEVHKSYLESGADIITTASYQASIPGFQKHLGVSEDKSRELIKLSVELAKIARDEFCDSTVAIAKEILIAGSVGSYGAALADGSEYHGNYCDKISHEDLIEWHRPRVQCLIEAGVDLLAFETIPAKKEGEALMKLLNDFPGSKAYLSFSSQSMHEISHGESMSLTAEACCKLSPADQLIALGVNCCPPECVESLLQAISSVCPDVPLIAYPNSGEKWNSQTGWYGEKTMSRESFLEKWIPLARIIGGCCRTSPEDIAKISSVVKKKQRP